MTQKKHKTTVIAFGNEKGGSGKSTLAMHIAVALIEMGFKVGTIDLDSRQGTLTRFFQNRWQTMRKMGIDLCCPMHIPLDKSLKDTIHEQEDEEKRNLKQTIQILKEAACDYIIIDTPGSDTHLSRLGHSAADILITPMNDSFIDLDLIAKIDGDTLEIQKPNIYSDMVWKIRQARAIEGKKALNWFIVRNRLSHLNAQNKKNIQNLLEKLQRRFGFTFQNGLSERVIFRELFLKGMTLMDVGKIPDFKMSMSHISGRQEVRSLVHAIGIKKNNSDLNSETANENQTQNSHSMAKVSA